MFKKKYPLLLKSKYLKDRCEVLFYYFIIDRDHKLALLLDEKLSLVIEESKITSKKRILLSKDYLHGKNINIACSGYEIISENPGIIKIKNNIIKNYFK